MPKRNTPPSNNMTSSYTDETKPIIINPQNGSASKKKRPKPILSMEEFVKQHRAKKDALEAYSWRNYRNKVELPKDLLEQLTPQAKIALYASNMESRISYVSIMHNVLAPVFLAEDRPIYWITLTPGQYTMSYELAREFNVDRLQAWTREVLSGLNFVGFVDIGCYPWRGVTHSNFAASFHVHLIAWGPEPAAVEALERQINNRWEAYLMSRPVMHWRRKSATQAIARIFYMAKAPLKSARFVEKLTDVDPQTGEVFERGRDRHYEQQSRTGQFARMSMIMQGHTLDKLAFAQGEGKQLLKKINAIALGPFRNAMKNWKGKFV